MTVRKEVVERARHRRVLAFVVAAILATAIWFLSVPITGEREPWDAEGPYYLFALALAGAISGALVPRHLGAHYLGALTGQAGYELAFLKMGPLFVLGLVFLAAYGFVFLGMAALGASIRGQGPKETSEDRPTS